MRERTVDRARGRWRNILPALGVPAKFLSGKHQPCPMCGGKDRARFDDKGGEGTWFCSHCGAGDGLKLLMKLRGWSFQEAARQVDAVVGTAAVVPSRVPQTDEAKREAMNRMWRSARPVEAQDPVGRYLVARGVDGIFPPALRTALRVRYHDEPPSYHPCMLAKLTTPEGFPALLHRTYLSEDGGKAAVDGPKRRMMPGSIPKGSAVRLCLPGAILGIAEGIETALAVQVLFSIPCWAATSDALLQSWQPPAEVGCVFVFGDSDKSYAGQAAAYLLAKRLVTEGRQVEVRIPTGLDVDWNDVLMVGRSAGDGRDSPNVNVRVA